MQTIRIKLNESVVGDDYTYSKGEEVDAPEDRAKSLIKAGHANPVEANAHTKSEKAISKQAQTAEKR